MDALGLIALSGGGSGGGGDVGKKLRMHNIHIAYQSYFADIIIIEANAEPYTKDTIEARLIEDSELVSGIYYYKFGLNYAYFGGATRYHFLGVRASDHALVAYYDGNSGTAVGFYLDNANVTVTDTVI